MSKPDIPSKMTTREYQAFSSRPWSRDWLEPADFVLSSFGIEPAGKVPRSKWLSYVLTSLGEAGWSAEPADIRAIVPPGITATVAIMAYRFLVYGSEETVLLATPGDVIIFRGCRMYDTASKGTVKRRITAMFFIKPLHQIGCGCADPVVFGHHRQCRRIFARKYKED